MSPASGSSWCSWGARLCQSTLLAAGVHCRPPKPVAKKSAPTWGSASSSLHSPPALQVKRHQPGDHQQSPPPDPHFAAPQVVGVEFRDSAAPMFGKTQGPKMSHPHREGALGSHPPTTQPDQSQCQNVEKTVFKPFKNDPSTRGVGEGGVLPTQYPPTHSPPLLG